MGNIGKFASTLGIAKSPDIARARQWRQLITPSRVINSGFDLRKEFVEVAEVIGKHTAPRRSPRRGLSVNVNTA